MTVNVFDQAARLSVDTDPLGFLRWLVPGLDPGLVFVGWLDTRTLPFPGTPDRTCDTVAHFAEAGAGESAPHWALVVEFQTEPEGEMLDRLLEYVVRLRRGLRFGTQRRGKFRVVGALVSLTGPPQSVALEMSLPGSASPGLRLLVATRTLREEDALDTLDGIAAGQVSRSLRGWISLMRGGGQPDIIERWKLVASQEPDQERRAIYGSVVLVFSDLTDCQAQWKAGLEGWDMRESTIVTEWRAEGKAEGRTEGLVAARRDALRQLLELKFGSPIPSDLTAAIEARTDINVLTQWFNRAYKADSLDAFRAAVE